jgi:two-component system CheB/CheR fusion protein
LTRFAPPSVVVDRDLNIVHMSDSAGRFLRHVGGEPSRNLLALVLPELRLELRTALYQAQQNNASVESQRVSVKRDERRFHVNMIVRPFNDDVATADFVLILFEETEQSLNAGTPGVVLPHTDLVLTQLEAELQRSKEKLQETIEHSEVSNEELRASNEELQAINEELRSATEELETSKEELQSVNEELITVNYELKVKVEETGKANDDLNNLIASTDIATIFVDRGMRIERFTPRASDLFNIIPADIGRSLLDITHRLDYDQLADDVSTTFETLRLVEREVRSNTGRYYIVRLLPYRTTEDKIEGAVMTFFDITGRREAEEKVRAGEEWMRLVAESTGDYAIMTMDPEGKITGWNKGAELNFGFTEAEMLGQPLDVIFTPEDRANGIPADEMRRAREDGRAEDERWHVRKDGSRLFCQGVMTPLTDGTLYGYAKIARDQTERVQQESKREAALSNEQQGRSLAESASAMKDEFLAIMSHELRHPLNLIYINAELLTRLPEVRQSPAALRATGIIRNSVSSQAKIIDDLLDMSRLSTGKLSLARSEVDLCKLSAQIMDVLKEDPLVAPLRLQFVQPDTPLMVSADAVRIEQVVLNLLNNAVKFTPAGGTVALTLQVEDGHARLDVADTGAGIEPRFLPHIFDMFGQGGAATVRSKTGLGIGLALVRHIVELHGGRVEAASEGAGQGSRFSLWLPLIQCDSHGKDDAPPLGAGLAGRRVLLVDDMEDSVYMFSTLLELEGASVVAATTARGGLDLLAQQEVDVIISDISMPDMDGYEFIQAVRAQPRLRGIPAIAASGLGREKDVQRAMDAGFSDHITKPIAIEVLCAKVDSLLAKGAS